MTEFFRGIAEMDSTFNKGGQCSVPPGQSLQAILCAGHIAFEAYPAVHKMDVATERLLHQERK